MPASEYSVPSAGVSLAASVAGDGPPVVLLHGLTSTRRYVVMGSSRLERSSHRVVAYDARGHGDSSPAPARDAYTYAELEDDLLAVLDGFGIDRAVLAGASMGAHTAIRLALSAPARVAGLVVITPGYDPVTHDDPARLARWDALADGLEQGGVEGFLRAYGDGAVAPRWREATLRAIEQRMERHRHPGAVADALRAVPRARPFGTLDELRVLAVPVTVVASDDEADPGHPQALAEAYATAIPDAVLLTDEPGRSPLAWQGSQVSAVIAEAVKRSGLR
jgi:pimeloyl-ACP methyl ester carboxylesterase